MYSYMIGKVTFIESNSVAFEVNSIGYQIFVANPYVFEIGKEITIFLYQNVKEDSIDLYGFKTKEQKDLFIKLISVKGIGPKSALGILATGNVSDVLEAIENGNASYLMKFPGIGQKASQQIILDLKGKINFEVAPMKNDSINQASEALTALGYKGPEIRKVLPKLDQDLSVSDMIKQALKLLLK